MPSSASVMYPSRRRWRAQRMEVLWDPDPNYKGWYTRIHASDGQVIDSLPPKNRCGAPRRNTSTKRLEKFARCSARHEGLVVPRDAKIQIDPFAATFGGKR